MISVVQPVLGSSPISLPKYIDEYQIPTLNSAPLAITIDRNGMVWFTESNVSKIAEFDPTSKTFHEYSVPGVGDMWGIVTDPKGYVWVTQYSGKGAVNPGGAIIQGGSGQILRFNMTTKNFTSILIPTNGSFPLRLALDQQGRVWFTELLTTKIGVYDPRSNRLREYPVPTNSSGPADLAFDANGMLWFSESYARQVGRFDPQSESFTEYRVGADTASQIVSSPVGIAIDDAHNLWLADHGGNWIAQFNPTTGMTVKYPTRFPPRDVYPISLVNDLLIDSEGRVWFCEHGGNSIGYYEPSDKKMVEYRIPSGPISTVLWLALASNGDVWFSEWSSNKIGVVHQNLPVPTSLKISDNHYNMNAGEKKTLSFIVASTEVAGNCTLRYSWSSYNPREASIEFTPAYPPLNTETQVQVQVAVINRINPGNYTLALQADLGDVTVSIMLEIVITQTQTSTQPIMIQAIILVSLIILIIAVIEFRRIRRPARVESKP